MNTANNQQRQESQNDFFRFLEIKTGKLATAVYMITNFLSDKEPIKWRLRDMCLSTLSNASILKEKNLSEQSNLLTGILSSGREIVSLLEIAHLSGFISEMNYSVLKREYLAMIQQITESDGVKNTVNKVSLPEDLFKDTALMTPSSLPSTHSSKSTTPYGLTEQKTVERNIKDNVISNGQERNDLLNSYIQKDIKETLVVGGKRVGRVEKAKNKRRDLIIQMLRDKNDLTIKEIAAEITDCSEKTIQRELVSLVEKGSLKKTGERRWSRYSLA